MQFNMMAAEEPLIRGNGWNDLELKEPDDLLPEQLADNQLHSKVHDSILQPKPVRSRRQAILRTLMLIPCRFHNSCRIGQTTVPVRRIFKGSRSENNRSIMGL